MLFHMKRTHCQHKNRECIPAAFPAFCHFYRISATNHADFTEESMFISTRFPLFEIDHRPNQSNTRWATKQNRTYHNKPKEHHKHSGIQLRRTLIVDRRMIDLLQQIF